MLVSRGLTYYWRSHVAVVLGVATAVATLSGALLVGDSVRGSLRDLVVQRLGRSDYGITTSGFFRQRLAQDMLADPQFAARFGGSVAMVAMQGAAAAQQSGRRAGHVRVYGIDDRFWAFHGVGGVTGPTDRDAMISPALARELGAAAGATILVRVERPSDMPLESPHGRKDDLGRTLRVNVGEIVPAARLGEFSIDPQQGDVRAVFVPLSRLQRDLGIPGRVNTVLVSARSAAGVVSKPGAGTTRNPPSGLEASVPPALSGVEGSGVEALNRIVRRAARLEDVGLRLRTLDQRGVVEVTSDSGLLDEARETAVRKAATAAGIDARPIFTYLATSLRLGDREVPYSLVSAIDLETMAPPAAPPARQSRSAADPPAAAPHILLNAWAARELGAKIGDPVSMDYYLWEDPGRLVTLTTAFRVRGIVPTGAGDPDLAPVYPGITDSPSLSDWDPPFPVDLRRVRPQDEEYWKTYRTTPKAFIPLETGKRLWGSRYGAVTSIRLRPRPGQSLEDTRAQIEARLRAALDPLAMGLVVRDVRADGLAASRGATDFGAYFVYFSFFLVASALLLASLFFKLGVEQRVREVGLLRAVGFGPSAVRRLFLSEGLVLAAAGSLLGVFGALGYAWLLMLALRTWWVDAVGTTAISLHVSAVSLASGAIGGLLAAAVCVWWALRSLAHVSERSLLAGQLAGDAAAGLQGPGASGRPRRRLVLAALLAAAGLGLMAAGSAGVLDDAGAFFAAGALLLAASLTVVGVLLRHRPAGVHAGHGWQPLSWLGLRNTTHRPGRSVLSMAVLASATFMIVSVDAFRRGSAGDLGPASGAGGYALIVETLLPIVHDPNTEAGRQALNLFDLHGVTFEPFRLLPGDDTSCLNLYEPTRPRILAPRDSFVAEGRFAFQSSLASTGAERANPWLLLHRIEPDGAVPVIADANSMTYVLHRQLGQDIVITRGAKEIRLRLVAALSDSIFQGELLMSQANFLKLFPDEGGYRVALVETAPGHVAEVTTAIERALSDFGADAVGTRERLDGFHKVENTYLSTFQLLGGLGLLLGTVGLATVLLRNVLERRRELALLQAVGYRRSHFLIMVIAENAVLLVGGLVFGAACAAIAIAPGVALRGGRLPLTSGGALLLFAVLVAGLLSSVAATRAATRAPLLEALRSE